MRGPLAWVGEVPHVVITVLMVVVIVDMLVGVFLRYVMTKVSAIFDLPSVRFFWVEEVGEWCAGLDDVHRRRAGHPPRASTSPSISSSTACRRAPPGRAGRRSAC